MDYAAIMRSTAALLLFALAGLHVVVGTADHFDFWASKFNKVYEGSELAHRRQVFEDNARLIAVHNAKNKHFQVPESPLEGGSRYRQS